MTRPNSPCFHLGHDWPKDGRSIQWCQRCHQSGRINPLVFRALRLLEKRR